MTYLGRQLTPCLLSLLHLQLVLRSKELLQSFEDPPDLCYGDFRQGADLEEGSVDFALTASNKDTTSDDGFLRFASERSGIVDYFEQMLGSVGYVLGNADGITQCAHLLICGQETIGALIMGNFVLSSIHFAAPSIWSIAERHAGLKLRAVEQRICTISNAGGVIIALIIV